MSTPARDECGFTLVETMMAVLVLVFGLMAVTNLLLMASASNTVGSAATAAAAQAALTMETLNAVPFEQLRPGGSLTAPITCTLDCQANPAQCPGACVRPDNYNARTDVPGVGQIETRWTIDPIPGDGQTIFITVESQAAGTLVGRRSRATFTLFRSCTARSAGCPNP